jgi:hypothetical protein
MWRIQRISEVQTKINNIINQEKDWSWPTKSRWTKMNWQVEKNSVIVCLVL